MGYNYGAKLLTNVKKSLMCANHYDSEPLLREMRSIYRGHISEKLEIRMLL